LMGYCSNVWLSEYTYGGITDRVASVNGNNGSQAQVLSAAALQPWRVLLVSRQGMRWGAPITSPSVAEGSAVSARILDAAGAVLAEVDVYRTEISDQGGAVYLVPEPKAGWNAVQIPGSSAIAFAKP